jgi:signal transduction histidine kinase
MDDGEGLRPNSRSGGLGLKGMQERVATLGGVVEVKNRSDTRGVVVSARLPAGSADRAERDKGRLLEMGMQ